MRNHELLINSAIVTVHGSQIEWTVRDQNKEYILLTSEAKDYRIIELKTNLIGRHDRNINLYDLWSDDNRDRLLLLEDLIRGNVGIHHRSGFLHINKVK